MKRRITKKDLIGAKSKYFDSKYNLIDVSTDDYYSFGDIINKHLNGITQVRYIEIVNHSTLFYARYRVYCPNGVMLSYKRID